MMAIGTLLRQLREAGVRLKLDGDKLQCTLPRQGLDEALKAELIARKDEVKAYIAEANIGSARAEQDHIAKRDSLDELVPSAFAQQRLWLIDKFEQGSSHYNTYAAFRFDGKLELGHFRQAFIKIIERHESLRTVFVENADGLFQQVRPFDKGIASDVIRLADSVDDEAQLHNIIEAEVKRPFDLAEDLMLRVTVIPVDVDSHIMVFVTHHIASDGWSLAVISGEMNELYQAACQGRAPQLAELGIQYADFALWQRKQWQDKGRLARINEVVKSLENAPQTHQLPLDFPRPAEQNFVGRRMDFTLSKSLSESLEQLAKRHKVTMFSLMESVFALLVARLSSQSEVVIGAPVAGRDNVQLEPLIGFFVNTLALRSQIDWQQSFAQFLSANDKRLGEALAYQDVPFDQVVDGADVPRNRSQSPLFQLLFAFQNNRPAVIDLPGLSVSDMKFDGRSAKFDLELHVTETDHGMACSFYYATALFSAVTIDTFANAYRILLEDIVVNEDASVAELKVTETSLNALPAMPQLPHQGVHQFIEKQSALNGDNIALTFGELSLSYAELNTRANQLARRLIDSASDKVAVYLPRSLEMVVAIVAVLKSGRAYLPIDTDLPSARVQGILADAGDLPVISNADWAEKLDVAKRIILDEPATKAAIDSLPIDNLNVALDGSELAYVLYTSGSTGKPKSIGMPHRALVNLIEAMQSHQVVLQRRHTAIQFASVGFDMSFTDIFLTMRCGGKLVMLPPGGQYDVVGLVERIKTEQVSLLNLPYSMLHSLAEYCVERDIELEQLRCVISTAEQLKITPQIRAFFRSHKQCVLVNHYGPSETHVITALNLEGEPDLWPEIPSIGVALDNIHCAILDPRMQPVAQGMPGLLYIGGVSLADGYLNRPDLSAEKFVHLGEQGHRYYNTGDLVRLASDGNFTYLGRQDKQIKLRGFRIEAGEVEQWIYRHDAVSQAVVTLDKGLGFEQLVAYVQLKDITTDEAEKQQILTQLKQDFSANLPSYMIPAVVQFSDSWPLNVNGKVDLSRFAPIEYATTEQTVEPASDMQREIVALWSKLLGRELESISVAQDFFSAGGNSLLLTRMLNEIGDRYDRVIAVADVINDCSVVALERELLSKAQGQRRKIEKQGKQKDIAVSFNQQRMLLLAQMPGGSALYNMPISLELEGHLDVEALRSAFEQVIERHEILRTRYEFAGGFGLQTVESPEHFKLIAHDLSHLSGEAQTQALAVIVQKGREQTFDMARAPMIRAELVSLDAERHMLLVVIHHIAFDGWSNAVLVNELREFYHANKESTEANLAVLPIQYSDYALWQQQSWMEDNNGTEQYWLEQLANLPAVHSLPLLRQRDGNRQADFQSVEFKLSGQANSAVDALAKQHKVSTFVVMYAAFSYLLSHWGQSKDTVVGTPVAGRDAPELESLLGFFINTVVLRNQVQSNATLAGLIEQCRDITAQAFAHQSMPFELLLEKLNPRRSNHYSPLFQIWFVMQNNAKADLSLPGLDIEVVEQPLPGKYELNVYIEECDGNLEVRWLFDANLYAKDDIEFVGRSYTRLLELLEQNQHCPLEQLTEQLWQTPETATLVPSFSAPLCDGDIYGQFQRQAALQPDAIALETADEQVSYGELYRRVEALALRLEGYSGSTIGLMLGQSEQMVVAMMACLKLEICYVPMDAALPLHRLNFIALDAETDLVLCNEDTLSVALQLADKCVIKQIDQCNDAASLVSQKPAVEAAYILYTSGTTGEPKGVKQSRENLHHFAELYRSKCQMNGDDRVSLLSAFGFDSAVMDTFAALICGARLQMFDIQSLQADELAARGTTIVHCTPTLYRFVFADVQQPLEQVRLVIMGGEPVVAEDLVLFSQAFNEQCQFVNGYGLSESTMALQWWPSRDEVLLPATPNLGYPVVEKCVRLVNDKGQTARVFEHAQIVIEQSQVALGYHKRDALSEQVFSGNGASRSFSTGDYGFYLPSGQIRFVGRRDLQVKLNGVRIELGEIEGRLRFLPGVVAAAVVLHKVEGREQLCAFLQASDAQPLSQTELSTALLQQLPAYMVPTHYLWLDEMPLTHSGKVLRAQLPTHQIAAQYHFVAPKTDTQKRLAAIWQALFNREQVGIEDGFHQLGGHSLQVMRMLAQIREQFALDLSFTDVVQASNILKLSEIIDQANMVKRLKSSGKKANSLSI